MLVCVFGWVCVQACVCILRDGVGRLGWGWRSLSEQLLSSLLWHLSETEICPMSLVVQLVSGVFLIFLIFLSKLFFFVLPFLVGCWPTHASGVITASSSDTMQRAEIWAWAHRWWLEHRTFSGKQYLSRSRLWIRYPDLQNISFALYYSYLFSLFYISLLFYILENFVKRIAVLLILDKCNLYTSQNTKFVKTKDMKIQYDKTPIERYNFRSLYGETSCFSIWN